MKILSSLILTLISVIAFSQQHPVVIELFTSQGCSSCPSADRNLAELIERAEKTGQPVYGLSFHVDYWNYIGWKDPYSNPEYTARQRKYSQVMNSVSVYTPQMIINGEVEFVGSNKQAGSDAVANALTKPMDYQVTLKSIQHRDGKIIVSYSLNHNPSDLMVNAAVAERKVENDVSRGENSGRRLAHRNVVRAFVYAIAQKDGVIEIDSPDGLTVSSLIIFIQDKSWHIKGATATKID